MYATLIAVISLMLINVVAETASLSWGNARQLRADNANAAVAQVSGAVRQYMNENGLPPADLATLASTAGFEYIRPAIANSNELGYQATNGITDGVWQFSRAGVFTLKFSQGETIAEYTAQNSCGTGALTAAASWCGSKDTFWARHETRHRHVLDLIAERVRQRRLMQKLVNAYNAKGEFPNPGGDHAAFSALAGAAGDAKTCAGAYAWEGVPIDCSDIYSIWGTPTVLNFFSPQHITIVADSSIKNNAGENIGVATDMSLE